MALMTPKQARKSAAHNLAARLIRAYTYGRITRNQALEQCHKVVDDTIGLHAWRLFLKGIK